MSRKGNQLIVSFIDVLQYDSLSWRLNFFSSEVLYRLASIFLLYSAHMLYWSHYNIISCRIWLPVECMLPNPVLWCHNVQGSIQNHGTRLPPHYNLPIGIYKEFPTPPGPPYIVFPTVQHHFHTKLSYCLRVCFPMLFLGTIMSKAQWIDMRPPTLCDYRSEERRVVTQC